MSERAMEVWGRKVARLPDSGVLLFATDLQGNYDDYEALKAVFFREKEAGHDPVLVFCGDLVHGPSPDLNEPGNWPEHLGTPYHDRSVELLQDYEKLTRHEKTFTLIGNHEHAHIGGPMVAKFYEDEAAILDADMGDARDRMHDFIREFPLIAVGACGVVLTHAAPYASEPNLESFERLDYEGYDEVEVGEMTLTDTLGALLWARAASREQAKNLLEVTSLDGDPNAFVAYGHDVVQEGWETVGDEQICISTSFGLYNEHKVYMRLDLSRRYRSAKDLRPGEEIRKLYP